MNELMLKFNCLSMGEGAPGYKPPPFLRQFMIDAIDNGHNQYCRSAGHPLLVNEISKRYGPKLQRNIDPLKEVQVTNGANGSLSSYIQALINPGDECVIFEPTFPMYIDHLQMAGGVLKTVPLQVNKDKQWVFDLNDLEQ